MSTHGGGVPYLQVSGGDAPRGWPLAFAHRGYAPNGEENTMAAFRAAVELGFGYLELDVRTTRDGVPMVFHDEELDRTTDGTGRVADRTLAELRGVRVAGREPIPTFEELLGEWPDIRLNVDVKDRAGVVPVARIIEDHGAHARVMLASFSDARRRQLTAALGEPVAASGGLATVSLVTLLGPVGLSRLLRRRLRSIAALQVPERHGPLRVVTPAFVRRAHAAGLHVHVWVVDDPGDMRRLLDMGVDGLMADRADLLAEVMAERGQWPQYGAGTGPSRPPS